MNSIEARFITTALELPGYRVSKNFGVVRGKEASEAKQRYCHTSKKSFLPICHQRLFSRSTDW